MRCESHSYRLQRLQKLQRMQLLSPKVEPFFRDKTLMAIVEPLLVSKQIGSDEYFKESKTAVPVTLLENRNSVAPTVEFHHFYIVLPVNSECLALFDAFSL